MATKTYKVKVINTTVLNGRSGAGTSFKVIKTFKKGFEGYVVDYKIVNKTTWYKWKSGAWSSGKYLKWEKSGTLSSQIKKDKAAALIKKGKKLPSKLKKTTSTPAKITTGTTANTAKVKYGKKTKKSTKYTNKQIKEMMFSLTSTETNVDLSLTISDGFSYKPNNGSKSFLMNYGFLSSDLNVIRESLNLQSVNGNHSIDGKTIHYLTHHRFNRFKLPYADESLSKTFGVVIFTRPSLNLYKGTGKTIADDLAKMPEYYFIYKNSPDVFAGLTDRLDSTHSFHPLLSNLVTSFDINDESIDTLEHGETVNGNKILYGGTDIKSRTAGTFNVGFTDNYNLDIYKTLKLWERYISDIKRGVVSPKRTYIQEKILDYASSAYYFLLGPDGAEILFWSKYYGVFPTQSPSSEFSWKKGDLMASPNYNIPFAYSFKRDLDPFTLSTFNLLGNTEYNYKVTYNEDIIGIGDTWSGGPFIESETDSSNHLHHYLRFRL